MHNKYKFIIFDLDGTLIDSQKGILNSLEYSFKKLGIVISDKNSFKKYIGDNSLIKIYKDFGLAEEQALFGMNFFREYYTDRGIYEFEVYKGIKELLIELKENGFLISLATSKPTVFAEKILKKMDLLKYFAYVEGSDLKEDPSYEKKDIIKKVIGMSQISDNNNFLMVGDRSYDIHGAVSNNIDSVFCEYGYSKKDELESLTPAYSVKSSFDLKEILL